MGLKEEKPKFSLSKWYKGKMQKRKERAEIERSLESGPLRMITFMFTLVAMALGMSFLPLFPQPLPIFIAVLVAFVTFKKPLFGMPVGGAIIGLGLIYHLADLYFISFLGDTIVRVAFIVIWMALFVVLPLVFHNYRSAIAIDLGILAAVMLFFSSTFFLAIPLLLVSAVFFKKRVGISVVYYALISVPLQIMQYFQYTVLPIVRDDWWLEPGSSPPLFVPLNSIFKDLTASMAQFRLYDTSKIIYQIAGQTTWVPDWQGRTIQDALKQYVDSVPGMLMFVVIVVGLALTLVFFTSILVKEGLIGRGDKLFPCFTATIGAALFFILLGALQRPLAFTANITGVTMVLGTLATLLFTAPVAFIDYTPKQRATISEITQKARSLMDKLRVFEDQVNNVKENIPVTVTPVEGKLFIIKDTLEDIINKTTMRYYEQSEMDTKFTQLDAIGKDIDALISELNVTLGEYQIFANCQFSDWMGKLRDGGLQLQTAIKTDYQQEMPLEERIESIKAILEGGRALTKEVLQTAEPIYGIIRPLYDPSLPDKSQAVEFAAKKISTKEAPWLAIEALYTALNNWKKQYGADILASMKYLRDSLAPIANLNSQTEVLPPILAGNMPKVLDYAQKAEAMKSSVQSKSEREASNILELVTLRDEIKAFLDISRDVLSILYRRLTAEEEEIEHLLPTQDYLWDKNDTLKGRLKTAVDVLSHPYKFRINQIMENLPTYLSYVDESLQTIAVYTERKEFLLNYPTAEIAIEGLLKQKKRLSPKDLPFQPKFAGEYLRLYYSQRFGEFSFDKENFLLTRRT